MATKKKTRTSLKPSLDFLRDMFVREVTSENGNQATAYKLEALIKKRQTSSKRYRGNKTKKLSEK